MNYQKKLQAILSEAVQKGASDVHIVAGHAPIIRQTRTLLELEQDKLSALDAKGLAFELMDQEQEQRFLKEKEIDFAYEFDNNIRFRVNIFFQMNRVSAALRLIISKIRSLEELNLPNTLHKFIEARHGLVLITGASSQGKSTTLAALIDGINHQRKEHIITIEDPIEYVFQDDKSIIQQREVYQDALSFAKALRATLREDPDVIMVGEMRDLETIATAITAAETGHLVFATLHTNSASQTIHRAIDVFPPHQQDQIRAQLANSLLGVVSQRLLPTLKKEFVPVCEIMFANSAIKNLIRENKIHEIPSVIDTSADEGMMTLNKHLAELILKKEIDKQLAFSYSLDPADLKARVGESRLK